MGPSSTSSALRSEPAFGSLASMGARKLKKKPVLVVDPDELAQAHQLFQQGAAEQLDEYEPEQRPSTNVSLFGLAPMSEEGEDGMFAPDLSPLNDDNEDEGLEADAPAPEQVLALTRPRAPKVTPKAPQTNLFGTLPDAPPHGPSASAPAAPVGEPKPIEQPAPKPRLVRNYDDIAPGFSIREPAPSEPAPRTAPKQAARPTIDHDVASVIPCEDDDAPRPAPKPLEPPPSAHSQLRARLVREDVCLSQPRPSLWQRVVAQVQRWYWALTGR